MPTSSELRIALGLFAATVLILLVVLVAALLLIRRFRPRSRAADHPAPPLRDAWTEAGRRIASGDGDGD